MRTLACALVVVVAGCSGSADSTPFDDAAVDAAVDASVVADLAAAADLAVDLAVVTPADLSLPPAPPDATTLPDATALPDLINPLAASGAPCINNRDCTGDVCLPGPSFPSGYCSASCLANNLCDDPNASCRTITAAIATTVCFRNCVTVADCRNAEGYLCCPNWNPFGGAASVCYPGPTCPQ